MKHFRAGLLLPSRQYAPPLFHGLTLSATGMPDRQERDKLWEVVEARGGSFEQDLQVGKCTHLVAEAIGTKKHQCASQLLFFSFVFCASVAN